MQGVRRIGRAPRVMRRSALARRSRRVVRYFVPEEMVVVSVTASEARQRLFPLIEEVNEDQVAVEIVSKKGTAYLVSADEYRSLKETVYLLQSPRNAERLRQSIASCTPATTSRTNCPSEGRLHAERLGGLLQLGRRPEDAEPDQPADHEAVRDPGSAPANRSDSRATWPATGPGGSTRSTGWSTPSTATSSSSSRPDTTTDLPVAAIRGDGSSRGPDVLATSGREVRCFEPSPLPRLVVDGAPTTGRGARSVLGGRERTDASRHTTARWIRRWPAETTPAGTRRTAAAWPGSGS